MQDATKVNGGLFTKQTEKKPEKKAEKNAEEITAVYIKLAKTDRDAFKVFCIQHGMTLSEALADAIAEYMENHK